MRTRVVGWYTDRDVNEDGICPGSSVRYRHRRVESAEDTTVIVELMQMSLYKQQDLMREAEQDRLAAQLPRRRTGARRTIALACQWLADWLDDSNRYVRPAQSGPADWAVQGKSAYIWLAESVTPPAARDFKTRPTDQLISR